MLRAHWVEADQDMDAHSNFEIAQSPAKMVLALAGSVALTAACATLALHVIPTSPGSFHEFIGYVGVAFFGLGTIIIAYGLATRGGKTIVTLLPEGIRDVRLSQDVIPWSAIRRISTYEIHKQKFMVINVDPAAEAGIAMTRMARLGREANRGLGIDGLCVGAQGLKIGYDELLHRTIAFANAGQKREGEGQHPLS